MYVSRRYICIYNNRYWCNMYLRIYLFSIMYYDIYFTYWCILCIYLFWAFTKFHSLTAVVWILSFAAMLNFIQWYCSWNLGLTFLLEWRLNDLNKSITSILEALEMVTSSVRSPTSSLDTAWLDWLPCHQYWPDADDQNCLIGVRGHGLI